MAMTTRLDGRRLRREQNREAVLDALAELFAEGIYEPNTNDVAQRAGLSPRSLFRYFDDVDDLSRAAIEHELAKARPLVEPDTTPDAPTTEKIQRLVEARVRLHEATAPAARAARAYAHRNPVVAMQLRQSRTFLRNQLKHIFAPELASDTNDATLPIIDALLSFETYELMRHGNGLSKTKTAAALTNALTALLQQQP